MRGVYQAAFLQTFGARIRGLRADAQEIDIGRAFDLLVGTSTGGIVASALAAGLPLECVRSLYERHGRQIFPHQWLRATWGLEKIVRGLGLGNRRGNCALRCVLKQTFGALTMAQVCDERECACKALKHDDRLKHDAENRDNCVRQKYPEGSPVLSASASLPPGAGK